MKVDITLVEASHKSIFMILSINVDEIVECGELVYCSSIGQLFGAWKGGVWKMRCKLHTVCVVNEY